MLLKINSQLNYMFDGEKFIIFFQNENINIKNTNFGLIISKFFTKNFKNTFLKEDFITFFENNGIYDNEGVNNIINLFINNDIFLYINEYYKELFYISKKWYNPYNIISKLEYKYSDITYYYNKGIFSKNVLDLKKIDSILGEKLMKRISVRDQYIKTIKNISGDFQNLIKLSYGNIDFRKHTHVCNGAEVSTVHKTVPSAGGFYNIIIFSILSDNNIYYFNGEKNIKIGNVEKYIDFLNKILTKSAIWSHNPEQKGAIQFLNIENTKGVIFAFGIIDKIFNKYYHKALPFLLLEAGHIFQNISIFSGNFSIGTLEIGSILEEKIHEEINLNINNDIIKELFLNKKLLYLNTMLIGYTKE